MIYDIQKDERHELASFIYDYFEANVIGYRVCSIHACPKYDFEEVIIQ